MHAERSTDGDDPVTRSLVVGCHRDVRGDCLCQSLNSDFVERGSCVLRYFMRFQILRKVLYDDDCHCLQNLDRRG